VKFYGAPNDTFQDPFGFKLPSELIPNRTAKFLAKLQASDFV